ncbi:MAG TPA: tail fiber domain-containing protein [Candidatus Gastranaerophilaceae bacterium]|nr:tail fiber domain-containing protein [Candidatus Gastranaerophilaceae bacterium]
MNFNTKIKNAFTLAEMMVVLLVLSIVMAAFLPVITTRTKADRSSPWKYSQNNSDIYYGMGATQGVLIGATKFDPIYDTDNPKLAINMPLKGAAHIVFKENGTRTGTMVLDQNHNIVIGSSPSFNKLTNAISIGETKINSDSVAIGQDAWTVENESVAIGSTAHADAGANSSTVIGFQANSNGKESVSVGKNSGAYSDYAVALGSSATAGNSQSISIGAFSMAGGVSSIAIGSLDKANQTSANDEYAIAIGPAAQATKKNAIAIGGLKELSNPGSACMSQSEGSIAIGGVSNVGGTAAIGLGYNSTVEKSNSAILIGTDSSINIADKAIIIGSVSGIGSSATASIAIGSGVKISSSSTNSVAIGYGAQVSGGATNSVAIGPGVEVNMSNTIKLGADNTYVVDTPGDLHAGGDAYISGFVNCRGVIPTSDKRLKNIKGEFKGGLNEIKKLEIFNFTFKDDKQKTPMVGVMAQDLQKVFPDAVTKDKKGFLAIRQEDMFYSMVNAIKELDNIFQGIIKDFKKFVCTVEKIEDKIEALIKVDQINSKKIKELEAKNKQLEERLAKLERSK